MTHSIPCPVCKTLIPVELQRLLQGERFVCPNCHAAISLPSGSREPVKEALEKLEQMKASHDKI